METAVATCRKIQVKDSFRWVVIKWVSLSRGLHKPHTVPGVDVPQRIVRISPGSLYYISGKFFVGGGEGGGAASTHTHK